MRVVHETTSVVDRVLFFLGAVFVTSIGAVAGHESTPDPLGISHLGDGIFLMGLVSVIVGLGWLATLAPVIGRR